MRPTLVARLAWLAAVLALGCGKRDAGRDGAPDAGQADGAGDMSLADQGNADQGPGDAVAEPAPEGAGDVASEGACALDEAYAFWPDGGLRAYEDRMRIAPPRSIQITRDHYGGAPPETCMDEMPACGTDGAVDVGEVTSALAHPDVSAAFALPSTPLFGRDTRPVDGTVFIVERVSDGHRIEIGTACSGAPGCTDLPAGVSALLETLTTLTTETLARAACAALGP